MGRSGILLALSVSLTCSAQVTGTFSLEKTTFAPREPVFLSFLLRNEGKDDEEVVTADPYSFCSGYEVQVTRDSASAPVCFRGYAGSCLSGAQTLTPGATRMERVLLNYENHSRGEFGSAVREPGDYTVDASREIAYAQPGEGSRLYTSPDRRREHQVLHFRIDDALSVSPVVYEPSVRQLSSKDFSVRQEAGRTLAALAPPSLETLLLSFATSDDPAIKQSAPLALSNLGTKASLAALAQMLLHNGPGTYEFMMAAESLGRTHDPAWLPLLLEVADQHGTTYLGYAAESGGEASIAALVARLRTADDASSRNNVIYAFGKTGSRAAIPILIGMLGNGQEEGDARDRTIGANAALGELTHVSAEQGPDGSFIPSWRGRWQRWWTTKGVTAPVYKPDECVADTKLP